jgi:hypothetical protein
MCELLVETRVALTKVRDAGQHPLRERLTDAAARLDAALAAEGDSFDARVACEAIATAESALKTRRTASSSFER